MPGRGLLAGLLKHPPTDRHDQSRLLGHGDEAAWIHEAVSWSLPAHQRLDFSDVPVRERMDRLVVDAKLAERQRLPKVGFELEPLHRLLLHARVENRVPRLTGGLGAVHGDVRVAQQAVRVRASRGAQRQADARADEDVAIADGKRRTERLTDAFRGARRLCLFVELLQKDGELVTTQASHRVAGAHARLQTVSHLDQQGVARLVAQAVVDHLEVVQVEKQHRDQVLPTVGVRHGALESIAKEGSIGQPRQRIVERLVLERRFGLLAAANVSVDADDRAWLAAGVKLERPAAGHHNRRAVSASVFELAIPAPATYQLSVDIREMNWEPRLQNRLWSAAQHLGLLPAIQFLGATVPEQDRARLQLPDEDGVMRQVEQLSLAGQPGRLSLGLSKRREVTAPSPDKMERSGEDDEQQRKRHGAARSIRIAGRWCKARAVARAERLARCVLLDMSDPTQVVLFDLARGAVQESADAARRHGQRQTVARDHVRDADDLATRVDQRATGIARSQGDGQAQHLIGGRSQDAQAGRVAFAHRIAHRHDQVADAQAIGVPHPGGVRQQSFYFERGKIERERVAEVQLHVLVAVERRSQARLEGTIELDRMHLRNALGKVRRQHAETGADFQHDVGLFELREAADHAEDVLVGEEVLPELLLRSRAH